MKPYFLLIYILYATAAKAQEEQLSLVVTPSGDSIMMSAEKKRAIKIGNTTKYITVTKSKPVLLNRKKIFKIEIDSTISDSSRFAMYMGTPVRANGNVDSNSITTMVNYYRQISHIVDSCFDLFDKQLVNGVYSLELKNIIISETGKIVYYKTQGIKGNAEQNAMHLNSMKGSHHIPPPLQELFNLRLDNLLKATALNIFIQQGEPIPFYYGDFGTSFSKGKSDDTPESAKPKPPETWNN